LCLVLFGGRKFNDIDLTGLIDGNSQEGFAARHEDFKLLSRELAVLFTPSPLTPAETTGQAGFDFGIDYNVTDISADQAYWSDAVFGRRENRQLNTALQSLHLVAVGGNVRVALNEGFKYFPDIAVMGGIHTLTGSDDLTLLTTNAGASISKSFAIAGSFALTPFVDYQSIFYNAASEVIDADPTNTADVERNIVFDEVSIFDLSNRIGRFSLGLRAHATIVQMTLGVDINRLPEGKIIPQFGARAGLYF